MTELQEINIWFVNGVAIQAHLEKSGVGFIGTANVPTVAGVPTAPWRSSGNPKPASDAFAEILLVSDSFATGLNTTIDHIDNPCNTEFFTRQEQLATLTNLGKSIPVKVNGL